MSPDTLLASALELHGSGRIAEAAAAYRELLAQRPNDPAVLNNLGLALGSLGRLDEAAELLRRLLSVDPGHVEAHNNLGSILRRQGELDAAIECYRAALVLRPDYAEAHNNLGNVLRLQGRYAAAIASFERAIALKPDFAEAHNGLGAALQEQGRLAEAVAAYRRAIELVPDFWRARGNLASALDRLAMYADAVDEYRRSLAINDDATNRVFLAGTLLRQGKADEARAEARRILGRQEEPSFPHFQLGLLYARLGLKDGARTQLLRYLENDPEDSFGAGVVLAKLGFASLPERASDALLHRLYTRRAETWDSSAQSEHGYKGHVLVGRAFARLVPRPIGIDVLDAGCGTGLIDPAIVASARTLEGVDLSAEMLEHAARKGIYTGLHQGDLLEFMSSRPGAYDAIVSSATLIHFGDLAPVFGAAAHALRDGGRLIFTAFPNADEESAAVADMTGLAEGGCFVHGEAYIRRTAAAAGFDVESISSDVHEYVAGVEPRIGLVVTLRRRPRERQGESAQ